MTAFVLRLDLAGHEHVGNPAAQHALVRQMLGHAMQAIGSDLKRTGELSSPLFDAGRGVSGHVVIGRWEFSDAADPTRNPDEA
jgi:hypothetical protein